MMGDKRTADHALATYGTLAPGRPNAHLLDGLRGRWTHGMVRGRLIEQGWGAAMGYPAIVLDAQGPEVAVHLFVSADLPAHWARLDAFEGTDYRRAAIDVVTDQGRVPAWIYVYAGAGG